MPSYKLTYFNGRGRAEIARFLFAKAGVEYEDNRINRDDWPAMKDSMPFGQVPVLEVDGVKLGQSYAIVCLLAKRFGMFGSNDMEEAEIHMVCQCIEDFVKPILTFVFEKDVERKEALQKKYKEEQLPNGLKYLNRLLEKNDGGDGFFVGNSMTLADIYYSLGLDWPTNAGIELNWSDYPKLKALKDKVDQDPKIAAWIEKRPKTNF